MKFINCNHDNKSYPYEIIDGLTPGLALRADQEWGQARNAIISGLLTEMPEIANDNQKFYNTIRINNLEDWHWSWTTKALHCKSDEYKWFFLVAQDRIQAICIIYHPKESALSSDKIFYIDYIAAAFWNRNRPGYKRMFSNLGKIMIAHSIKYATKELGYRPGFCLHSLPGAESFYRTLGMTDLGIDDSKESLRFFEAIEDVSAKLAGIA
jgi:hypothetical protein